MEKLRKVATICIGRAVMFGAFAIGLIMISLSFDLVRAFSAGAILTLVMAQILIIKAYATVRQNPRKTETWSHLAPDARPVGRSGARVFRSVLIDVYVRFATHSLTAGCCFFATSSALRLMRALA
ncbi:hypothetical protein [Nitratireductor pacificus]|uniref:Uncharacterized protein n=1 Tax=Nitratireductor pacificus pht-3B TaxID=391937 RepID=K2MKB4_9HYPH|nr:hypothetical protein [Nitratireductor pacificus]EKF17657.1 hypothetical protein NA2_17232 [Nitratireductor pacificus pht-3B]